jgi:hypothetical protein
MHNSVWIIALLARLPDPAAEESASVKALGSESDEPAGCHAEERGASKMTRGSWHVAAPLRSSNIQGPEDREVRRATRRVASRLTVQSL